MREASKLVAPLPRLRGRVGRGLSPQAPSKRRPLSNSPPQERGRGLTEFAATLSHPNFGSSCFDHSAWSFQSFSVTVITCVCPSIATWPKNCRS